MSGNTSQTFILWWLKGSSDTYRKSQKVFILLHASVSELGRHKYLILNPCHKIYINFFFISDVDAHKPQIFEFSFEGTARELLTCFNFTQNSKFRSECKWKLFIQTETERQRHEEFNFSHLVSKEKNDKKGSGNGKNKVTLMQPQTSGI